MNSCGGLEIPSQHAHSVQIQSSTSWVSCQNTISIILTTLGNCFWPQSEKLHLVWPQSDEQSSGKKGEEYNPSAHHGGHHRSDLHPLRFGKVRGSFQKSPYCGIPRITNLALFQLNHVISYYGALSVLHVHALHTWSLSATWILPA